MKPDCESCKFLWGKEIAREFCRKHEQYLKVRKGKAVPTYKCQKSEPMMDKINYVNENKGVQDE